MPRKRSMPDICFHCGNRVPLQEVAVHHGQELFEQIDGKRYNEDFDYHVYQCPTCGGITIYAELRGFSLEPASSNRIYPRGSRLLPESHQIAALDCVPERIVELYREIWPLRHIAPNAFAVQIRRALEFVCNDQGASRLLKKRDRRTF
jgi:hypothetical protein